ncbi:ABC transporter permease [Streptomyces sp. NPDC057638]|uniref:ABC transporter permease n=1 Tax=Streptomyces sp. NPDC057638 TaxID=3346190 RepID=UPI0036CBF9F2
MSFTSVVHAEWLKISSLRSSWVALASVFLATLGFSLLMSATFTPQDLAAPAFDPLRSAFYGLNFGGLGVISLGAMAVAAEYKTGAIRISLAVVPRRGLLCAAKLTVVGALTFAVGLVTSVICFVVGQSFFGDKAVGLFTADGTRAVLGVALYYTLIGLFAAGLAFLLRSAVAVLSILIPLLMMVSFVVGDISEEGGFADFLPDRAGQQIVLQDPAGPLGPWTGLAVLALWAGAALAAGAARLVRKDA